MNESKTYERADIERILTVLFNGGEPWRSEEAPTGDMPKAYSNPSHGGTFIAEKVDVDRAWWASFDWLTNPVALLWHFGDGMTQRGIGFYQGLSPQAVGAGIARDVALLRDAANAGAKPRGRQLRRYLEVRKVG